MAYLWYGSPQLSGLTSLICNIWCISAGSNHYGICGFYSLQALESGLLVSAVWDCYMFAERVCIFLKLFCKKLQFVTRQLRISDLAPHSKLGEWPPVGASTWQTRKIRQSELQLLHYVIVWHHPLYRDVKIVFFLIFDSRKQKFDFFSIIVYLPMWETGFDGRQVPTMSSAVRRQRADSLTFRWWSRLLLGLAILSSCVCSSSGAFLQQPLFDAYIQTPHIHPGYRGSTTVATTTTYRPWTLI